MTDQQNTAPAVWDPTARGGAGGWVRGPQQQPAPGAAQNPAAPAPATPAAAPPAGSPQPPAFQPPAPQPPAQPAPGQRPPMQQPPAPGAVGDQGPPLGARPYLSGAPGYDAPTAPAFPATAPQPVTPPPAAPPSGGFPGHATPQNPGPGAHQGPPGGYGPPAAPQQPPYPQQSYGQQPYPQQPYGQPPYGQPDYATGYEDPEDEDRPGSKRAPVLIGFALLFVLALGGGILWAVKGDGDPAEKAAAPGPSATAAPTDAPASGNAQPAPAPTGSTGAPTPAATDTASASASASPTAGAAGPNAPTQAKALDDLLTQGESAKAPIGSAVAKVSSCPSKADIDSAAQVFDSGAKQRDQLLTKLATLAVTDLPGGADAVASLKSAWQLSADIDRAYASWARAVSAQGCSGSAPNTTDKKHADELNPQATQAKKDFVTKWKAIADTYGLTARTQDRI
ncbi:hypothetical protein J5Y04_20160 [Kitasatospora sp. RG8]|uniref:hypothetical protein n=1 Tax=Kitasatospora sp. RG8 TaxID=2820815 RepID=UPI001ADF7D9A|nr:hypothetical protein [Kitasatospora sp. RG8]MBP0451840.1 hypothetical protein [Kitasatospora sp. RG8]